MAGAITKDTASAKESSCKPNFEVALRDRARVPSSKSKTSANKIAIAAKV